MNSFNFQVDINQFKQQEFIEKCLGFIDLTSLNVTDTFAKIEDMVKKVNEYSQRFPKLPPVAAVCVYPSFTRTVRNTLTASDVRIAVTGAGFPASQTFLKIKKEECRMAVEEGADEVDIVLSLNHFFSENYQQAGEEISAIRSVIGQAFLKVIIESGILSKPASIAKACTIAIEAGADFIKTSTGKCEPAATPEAAFVICSAIREHYQKTGKQIGFKPAGGIVSTEDALLYYTIVHNVLGPDWLHPSLFRIGASRLANNLLTTLYNQKINYF